MTSRIELAVSIASLEPIELLTYAAAIATRMGLGSAAPSLDDDEALNEEVEPASQHDLPYLGE